MRRILVMGSCALVLLTGCATGKDKFGCSGMPDGVQCKSAEDVYRQTEGDLSASPWDKARSGKSKRSKYSRKKPTVVIKRSRTVVLPERHDPIPVRTPARVMRIWIAPWEDTEGNLHLASLVFTEIEKRRWVVGEPVGDAGLGSQAVWVPAKPKQAGGGSSDNTAKE